SPPRPPCARRTPAPAPRWRTTAAAPPAPRDSPTPWRSRGGRRPPARDRTTATKRATGPPTAPRSQPQLLLDALGRRLGAHLPMIQEHHPVAQRPRLGWIVRSDHRGPASAADDVLAQEAPQVAGALRIQAQ